MITRCFAFLFGLVSIVPAKTIITLPTPATSVTFTHQGSDTWELDTSSGNYRFLQTSGNGKLGNGSPGPAIFPQGTDFTSVGPLISAAGSYYNIGPGNFQNGASAGLNYATLDLDANGIFETVVELQLSADGPTNDRIIRYSFNNNTANNSISTAFNPPVWFVDAWTISPGNGKSWSQPFRHLNDALAAAQPGAEIRVASGSYQPDRGSGATANDRSSTFTIPNSVKIYGGYHIEFGSLLGRDPDGHPSILSGDLHLDDGFIGTGENAYHVVTADGVDSTTLLDGFTIQAGNADGTSPDDSGAGLRVINGATPTFNNVKFFENTAALNGGAVSIVNSSPIFTDCRFARNEANNHGGALVISGAASTPVLRDCEIVNNTALNQGGGAIVFGNATPQFIACRFLGNEAGTLGGAMAWFGSSTDPIVINSLICGNKATNGGGLYTGQDVDGSFVNVTFQGNRATGDGGAIRLGNLATTSFANVIVWNNVADGSHSEIDIISGGTPVFIHSLVKDSTAATLDAFTGSSGNLDGDDAYDDPAFLSPLDPLTAPTSAGGDWRLQSGSPALDAGDNASNSALNDIDGNPRIANTTIDLGAHEGAVATTPIMLSAIPETSGPVNASSINFTVVFNKPVVNFNDITDLETGGPANVGGVTITGGGAVYTVTLTGITGEGNLRLRAKTGSDVQDLEGNTLGASTFGPNVAIDNTAPVATQITTTESSPTSADSIEYAVTFNDPVVNLDDASDFIINTTGSVAVGGVSIAGSDNSWTVTLTGITGDGTLSLSVDTASDVENLTGLALASSVTSEPVTIDNTANIAVGSLAGDDGFLNQDETINGFTLSGTSDAGEGRSVIVRFTDSLSNEFELATSVTEGNWTLDTSTLPFFSVDPAATTIAIASSSVDNIKISDYKLASFSDGSSVVVWRQAAGGNDYDIYQRRIGRDGVPIGPAVEVSTDTGTEVQFYPDITPLDGGGWVVVWDEDDNLHHRRYDAAGAPVGSEIVLPNVVSSSLYSLFWTLSIAPLDSGGWATLMEDTSPNDFMVYRFAADGTLLGNSPVNSLGDDWESPKLVRLADGRLLATWDSDLNSQGYSVEGQFLDSNGVPIGVPFFLMKRTDFGNSVPLSPSNRPSRLVSLADGGFVVASPTHLNDSTGFEHRFQTFNSDGSPRSGVIDILSEGKGEYMGITTLADGGIAVAWTNNETSISGDVRTYGRIYEADGSPRTAVFPLIDPGERYQVNPELVALVDGGWTAVWADFWDGTSIQDPADLVTKTFQPDGLPRVPANPAGFSLLSDGPMTVTVETEDAYGNFASDSFLITLDATGPQVSSITPETSGPTSLDSIEFDIVFNEAVVNFDAFADLTIQTSGTLAVTGASFSGSGTTYTVTLTGISGDGDFRLGVGPDSDVQDSAGNDISSITYSTWVAVDRTPPNAASITTSTLSPTNADSLTFTVLFDDPVFDFDTLSDLVLTTTGTVTIGGATFSGPDDLITVTLTGITGDGTLTVAVNTDSDVDNIVGLPLASSVTSAPITIDNTAALQITSVAGDGVISLAERDQGFSITGTTTDIEDGQLVSLTFNEGLASEMTGLAQISGDAWTMNTASSWSFVEDSDVAASVIGVGVNATIDHPDYEFAQLHDGSVIAVWPSKTGPNTFDVYQQVIAPDGRPTGSPVLLDSNLSNGDSNFTAVTVLNDGSWVTAWYDAGNIYFQRFSSNGNALIPKQILSGVTLGTGRLVPAVRLTPLNHGGWAMLILKPSSGEDFAVYRFADNGSLLGTSGFNSRERSDNPGGDGIDITTLADGRVIAVWTIDNFRNYSRSVEGQLFDTGGFPVGDSFLVMRRHDRLNGGFVSSELFPGVSVTALKDGGYAVAASIINEDNPAGKFVRFQIFNHDQTNRTNTIDIFGSDVIQNHIYHPDIVGLRDGGLVLSWAISNQTPSFDITAFARIYEADGTLRTNTFLLDDVIGTYQVGTVLAPLPDGGWLAGWSEYNPLSGSDLLTLKTKAFQPDGTPRGPADFTLLTDAPVTISASASDLAGNAANDVFGADLDLDPASPTNTYETWALARGLTLNSNSDLNADPNDDGKPNLLHFAYDTDPLGGGGNENKRALGVTSLAGEDYLTWTVPVRNGATFSGVPLTSAPIDGLIYEFLGTHNLKDPSLYATEVTPALATGLPPLGDYDGVNGPDYQYRTFRLNAPISALPSQFIWSKISPSP